MTFITARWAMILSIFAIFQVAVSRSSACSQAEGRGGLRAGVANVQIEAGLEMRGRGRRMMNEVGRMPVIATGCTRR
jgi:hypothetical protein